MTREHHCKDCGFDLSTLPMSIVYAGRGVGVLRRKLYCPICRGGPLEFAAERLAFPRTSETWVRWRESGVGSVANEIAVGRLRLRIEARVETLNAEQICYRAVPVFHSIRGRVCPTLPVRPEYLDCLDPAQLDAAQRYPERFGKIMFDGGNARYRCVIPLRGLLETEWPTIECDLLPADPQSSTTADIDALAFRGVSMRLWPNLRRPAAEWKFYVAWIGASSDEGLRLFAQGRSLCARLLVLRDEPSETRTFTAVPLDFEQRGDGNASAALRAVTGACAIGRPAWVSLEFRRTDGDSVGGGLFAVRPTDPDARLAGERSLGLDFGTTNTVIAVKRADGTIECIAPEHGSESDIATEYVIHNGAPTDVRIAPALDLWPGGAWLGPHHDLLPSDLAGVKRWTDVATPERIASLVFGRDFGVPIAASRAPLPPDQVVSEFKWLRAVQKEKASLANPDVVEALQARYLEAALLMAAAALGARSESNPESVTVYYGYPLAFETQDLRTLERAAKTAEHALKACTGINFKFIELMDEAQAAAGTVGPSKMFRVCVDLGGGSLDVLVEDTWARTGKFGHEGLHPHVHSTSVFFGGSVYLRSLLGSADMERRSGCVLPAMASYTRLASEVRRWESGQTLIDSPEIIAEARKDTAVRRARAFMGYVVELVARVLAGVCLEHGRGQDDAIDFSRNRLFTLSTSGGAPRWALGTPVEAGRRRVEFSLVLLGNGWGFGDIVRDGLPSVEQMISQRVRIRLKDLLRASPVSALISDGTLTLSSALTDEPESVLSLEVTCEPTAGSHRKARVARGLLEARDQPPHAKGFETRANGPHGVLGFDVSLADSGRAIGWFRPFGPPARDRPELMASEPVEGKEMSRGAAPKHPAATRGKADTAHVLDAAGSQPSAPVPPTGLAFSVGALESYLWVLTQQWDVVVAAADRAGVAPFEYARRQLWAQVTAGAVAARQSPEGFLAAQRWEQLMPSTPLPHDTLGDPSAPAMAPAAVDRWNEVRAAATGKGASPHAVLAAQRWEQLMATLARSIPLGFEGLPEKPPFPIES